MIGLGSTAAVVAADEGGDLAPAEAQAKAQLFPERHVSGLRVNLEDSSRPVGTTLFGLQADDGALLQTYCVELHVPIDPEHTGYEEVPWDAYPNPDSPFHQNRDKVNWILHHSYPAVDLAGIEQAVEHEFDGGLSVEEAVAATQASVWHFSDGANLDEDDPTQRRGRHSGADVVALYQYLTGEENVGIGEEPEPELALDPAALAGETGTLIGPFTVSTSAEAAQLSSQLPEGVELVDGDSQQLGDEVTDGSEIYVDVPEDAEDGAGTLTLETDVALSLGRLFVGDKYNDSQKDEFRTQSLILAGAENTHLEVSGEVTWTTPDEPEPEPTETPEPTPTPTPEPTTPPDDDEDDDEEESPTPEPTTPPEDDEDDEESPSPEPTTPPEETTPPEDDEDDGDEGGDLPDTGADSTLLLGVGAAAMLAGAAALGLQRRGLKTADRDNG
ncbi:thioester domain-containing protein [Phytoactinopolyspora halotolerans]|uniref:Cys-Gln thioester bond-forming surface protein n=1 Tax=Phytoactinopolyspora halotolerans TaxID=1981512 RepID=A0A6L9S0M8_9ACTN|nr:thioester domain-containing protein [Phytoactinopolyspora halotolerans]NED99014.1 Cys-Gln thioester bond-forming surface protein [Phytoactinopolyspora halotolerans]